MIFFFSIQFNDNPMGSFLNPHISKCSMITKRHQLDPMPGDVRESEIVKTLQLYATSRCTSVSTQLLYKKQCFYAISALNWVFTYPHSFSLGFTNDCEFSINVNIISRHSNLNFTHHLVIYQSLQNAVKMNQHLQKAHQRETMHG